MLLKSEGDITIAGGVDAALREISLATPDLVLLDLVMPGRSGLDLLAGLSERGVRAPVIMLTARGEEADRIVGLEIGADDYLPKTFSTRELLARLRAVTRRAAQTATSPPGTDAESEIIVGSLHVNPSSRTAVLGLATLAGIAAIVRPFL